MGIVLTVLSPPHPPEPNLLAALPAEVGRVVDVESRLVSPRYDTLLVTTQGLIVRDQRSGDFHGVTWTNFSVDSHLRRHIRHATVILWLNDQRPTELAITLRVADNIASIAPVLKQQPSATVDDIVVGRRSPEIIDLRQSSPVGTAPPPTPTDRVDGIPPPISLSPSSVPQHIKRNQGNEHNERNHGNNQGTERNQGNERLSTLSERPRLPRLITGVAILVLAGTVGGVASLVINDGDGSTDGAVPVITSEAVDIDQLNP